MTAESGSRVPRSTCQQWEVPREKVLERFGTTDITLTQGETIMTDLTDIPDFLRRTPKERKLPGSRHLNTPMARASEVRGDTPSGQWSEAGTRSDSGDAGDVE